MLAYENIGAGTIFVMSSQSAWDLDPFSAGTDNRDLFINMLNADMSTSSLYADLGTLGLWKHDGTSWLKLAPENPEAIAASGSILYADLGALGLWKHDGTSWSKLAPENPEAIAASGSTLYADLGISVSGNTTAPHGANLHRRTPKP